MNIKNILSPRSSVVAEGAEVLKNLKRLTTDTVERGQKYQHEIFSEARQNVLRYEELQLAAGHNERPEVESRILMAERKVAWAQQILKASRDALDKTQRAIDQGYEGLGRDRSAGITEILSHMDNLPIQRTSIEEAQKRLSLLTTEHDSAVKALGVWDANHSDLSRLDEMLNEESGSLKFRPWDRDQFPLMRDEIERRQVLPPLDAESAKRLKLMRDRKKQMDSVENGSTGIDFQAMNEFGRNWKDQLVELEKRSALGQSAEAA